MSQLLTIKKGLDLKIAGGIGNEANIVSVAAQRFAITPADFPGLTPKVEVEVGDEVVAGQALLHDKADERIKLVAPVAGTVEAIVRGERRRIEHVIVRAAATANSRQFDIATNLDADQAKTLLMESGLWAMMRQRPYDIVPQPEASPRDIFVTAFDSAPLAADIAASVKADNLAAGVKLLKLLTAGSVYISRRAGSALPDIAGAEMVDVKGPHPAGNAGVQIANIAPVNKGETVWTLDVTTLNRIGHLVLNATTDWSATVAVTGTEVATPRLVSTYAGAEISALLAGNLVDDNRNKRIISGNVLTGTKVSDADFLRYPYRQLTVIAEGDDVNEFMGWASLSPQKMSQSRSFPGHFLFKKLFSPDARLLGGRRALIMSGEYDKYLPMDIMAEYLLKAIIGRDIEKMEELGIYEVAPEDFALGEYADTSKIEAQKIVREGLDYLRKELQ